MDLSDSHLLDIKYTYGKNEKKEHSILMKAELKEFASGKILTRYICIIENAPIGRQFYDHFNSMREVASEWKKRSDIKFKTDRGCIVFMHECRATE